LEVLVVVRRVLLASVVVAAATAVALTTLPIQSTWAALSSSEAASSTSSKVLWGMDDNADFDATEASVGRKFAVVREYRRLDQSFSSSRIQALAASDHSMVVSVKSRNATGPIPYTAITSGQYDSTFVTGLAQLNALPTPTYFIFQHEADSTAAKAACSQPTDAVCGPEFVAAWKHVYNLAEAHGFQKLMFTWTITNYGFNSQTGVRNDYYWPGASYTDWLGVDAYNGGCEGTWYGSFEESLASSVSWAKTHAPTKPIIIPELGATEGSTASAKANFFNGIPAALTKPGYENVKAIVYWNNAESNCNFKVDSSTASFNAYRTVGQHSLLSAKASDAASMTPTGTTEPPAPTPTPSPGDSPPPVPTPSPSGSPPPAGDLPRAGQTVAARAGGYTYAAATSQIRDIRATLRMPMKAGEVHYLAGTLKVASASVPTGVAAILACRTQGATHALDNVIFRSTTSQSIRAGSKGDALTARLEFTAPADGVYDCALDTIFNSRTGGRIYVVAGSAISDAYGPLRAAAQAFTPSKVVVSSSANTAVIDSYTVPDDVSSIDAIGDVNVTNCYGGYGNCPDIRTTNSSLMASQLVVNQLNSDGSVCLQSTDAVVQSAPIATTTRTIKSYHRRSGIAVSSACSSRDFQAYIRVWYRGGNIFQVENNTLTNSFIFDR
jgi:hypothetical protein